MSTIPTDEIIGVIVLGVVLILAIMIIVKLVIALRKSGQWLRKLIGTKMCGGRICGCHCTHFPLFLFNTRVVGKNLICTCTAAFEFVECTCTA